MGKYIQRKNNDLKGYSRGMQLYRSRQYREAIPYLEADAEKHRNDVKVLFTLAKCYIQIRQNAKVEGLLNKILEIDKDNIYAHFELGRLYVTQKREADAEKEFRRYMEIDQDRSPHAHLELGRLYVTQKREADAEKEFRECIKIDQDRTPHAHLELGRLYVTQKREADAEKEFRRYMEIDQDRNPHAHLELGRLYVKQGSEADAEKEFRKCMEIDQDNEYADKQIKKLDTYNIFVSTYFSEVSEMENLDFEIFPKGIDESEKTKIGSSETRETQEYPESFDAKNRYGFLKKLCPTKCYKGLDSFKGYLMFQYSDRGICVLEKFFDVVKDENEIEESKGNATYIFPMNISVELSKLAKKEIMQMMKEDKGIQRQIHSGDYYRKLCEKMDTVELEYLINEEEILLREEARIRKDGREDGKEECN